MDADRLEELLAAEAVWAGVPAGHEQAVSDVVARHRDGGRAASPQLRRWRRATAASSVIAAVSAVVAVIAFTAGGGAAPPVDTSLPLTATVAADGATATVAVTVTGVGTRLRLDVDGLAAAGSDEVYEGWMLDGDRAVSAGTFHLRTGEGPVWLWTGVAPDEFDEFVVTRHPIGTRSAPTTVEEAAVVLRGTLAP